MKRVTAENNLLLLYPDLASEWHPQKNKQLKPNMVTPHCWKRVWWKCPNGHEWSAYIPPRVNGTGCPYCQGMLPSKDYNLRIVYPDIASEWHPIKNGDLKPENVTPGSEKRVWWKCSKNHEWSSTVYNRKYHGCPICAREKNKSKKGVVSLAKAAPHIIGQWHPTKNEGLTPYNFSYGSKKKIWWICNEGHEFYKEIKARVRGIGCPYCSGHKPSKENNLLAVFPQLEQEWHPSKNGNLKPDMVTPHSEKVVWWICGAGHEYKAEVGVKSKGGKCPECRQELKRQLDLQKKIAKMEKQNNRIF